MKRTSEAPARPQSEPAATAPTKPNGNGAGHVIEATPELAIADQRDLWDQLQLECQGNGRPVSNMANVIRILEGRPEMLGVVWYDDFLRRYMTARDCAMPRQWIDPDYGWLRLVMQRRYGLQKTTTTDIREAVHHFGMQHRRNPLREWLLSLKWDGTERLPAFLADVFGTPTDDYHMAAGRNFFVAMAARVLEPGCKVDNMLVLEGSQGIGKSMALKIIGGDYFAEASESVQVKDFLQCLQGKWLVEIAELDAFSRAEVTKVKQVLSCSSDTFRASYDSVARDWPRQGVLAGTTNRDDYSRDETGARRLWPVACKTVNLDVLRQNREQYFAEAVHRYQAGEPWHLMPDSTAEQQEARRYVDDWESIIANWLLGRSETTSIQVMQECLRIETAKISHGDQIRVAKALRALGWTVKVERNGQKISRIYRPTN